MLRNEAGQQLRVISELGAAKEEAEQEAERSRQKQAEIADQVVFAESKNVTLLGQIEQLSSTLAECKAAERSDL